jgi:hypothetical protein
MNMMLPVALHAACGFFRIVQRTLGQIVPLPVEIGAAGAIG